MNLTENRVKELLRPVVIQSISDGYNTFITGMARGFDLWAADIVLHEKEHFPNIHLICALPIADFEKRWTPAEQEITAGHAFR